MKVLIFDLDDTLLMSNSYKNYNNIIPNNHLNYILNKLPNKKFIYTNGTYNHGVYGLKHMGCSDEFKMIYARDTIPFMKPDFRSFNYVNNSILYDFNFTDKKIFFDDLQSNLKTANKLGWETVWINPKLQNSNKLNNYIQIF